MKGKTNFSRRLPYKLSGSGIVECLVIIDVKYNLKQFDGLTWLTLNPIFYDRSTPQLFTVLFGSWNFNEICP